MALAVWDEVAEAVKNEINQADFGIAFTAVRSKEDTTKTLESLSSLRVDVQHYKCRYERNDRESMNYHCTTRIIVRKRFETSQRTDGELTNDVSDPYSELLQKMLEYFCPSGSFQGGRELLDMPEASWDDEENMRPNRVGSFLLNASTFCGWIDVTHVMAVRIGQL